MIWFIIGFICGLLTWPAIKRYIGPLLVAWR